MRQTVPGGQVGLEIVEDPNRSTREHQYRGELFVEATHGREYQIRLINLTSRRVLAVLSVDGLSVMDGKEASKSSHGYVLDAYQTADIPGWRLNSTDVAKFQFGSVPDAYAATQGKPKNIGVIGCHFVAEKDYHAALGVASRPGSIRTISRGDADREEYTSYKGEPTSKGIDFDDPRENAPRGVGRQAVGTEFGQQAKHRVVDTVFTRGADLATIQIRYNDRENLIKMGVISESPVPTPSPPTRRAASPRTTGRAEKELR